MHTVTILTRFLFSTFFFLLTLEAAPIKIMPLGDSITEGVNFVPAYADNNTSTYSSGIEGLNISSDRISYRGKLSDLLKSSEYSFDFVGSQESGSAYEHTFDMNHEGHGGRSTFYFQQHIASWLDTNPADVVLMHMGTNDPGNTISIGSYDDSDTNRNTSINNIRKILDTVFSKNPNTKVFIARIIEARRAHAWSVSDNLAGNNQPWRTNVFNNRIEALISHYSHKSNIKVVNMEQGAGIIYEPCGLPYDMNPYHEESYGNEYDFHPNKNGYAKMAQKWFDALQTSGWLPHKDIEVPVIVPDTWYKYQKKTQEAKIRSKKTTLRGHKDLNVSFTPKDTKVWLSYKSQDTSLTAYIYAIEDGNLVTGFKDEWSNDTTLQEGTMFISGSHAVIKEINQKIVIETSVTLNKDNSLFF